MRTPTPSGAPPGAVVVAVGGTAGDRTVLAWAAEEAERDGRPVLLTHAAGHLPPQMTYAERRVAREEVRARSQRLVEDAARFVHRLVPGVQVTTLVRLLDPDALLPAIARDASTLTRTSPAWLHRARREAQPVLAAVGDREQDAHVVQFATGYAAHRGLDLTVVEGRGRPSPRQLLDQAPRTSLVLLPRPSGATEEGRWSWPETLDVVRSSGSPVVLVSGSGRDDRRGA
jgi:hypothetical protein